MSSPIHSALFSPPPSPPSRSKEMVDLNAKHGFTSIKSLLLPADLAPRTRPALSLEKSAFSPYAGSGGLKVRSPRTPSRGQFAFEQQQYPSAVMKVDTPRISLSAADDIEATPRAPAGEPSALATASSTTLTPRRKARSSTTLQVSSPPLGMHNVPSTQLPVPASLPRPLLRLIFFASLLFSSALILVYIPGARLPSFHASALTRRFSFDLSTRTHSIAELSSWQESLDRDYSPPQIRAPHMLRRAFSGSELERTVPPPLKAIRPTMIPRPLPESHEILAIQSYLLDSSYNVLSADIDPSSPVDANKVTSHKQMGKPGSAAEQAWLEELEHEQGQDVVIWYGGDGNLQLPHDVLDILHGLHGSARHPTLLSCHGRSDSRLLQGIFDRLAIPFKHHPLVMIGNVPVIGDADTLEDMRATGALRTLLRKIGWVHEEEADADMADVADVADFEEVEVMAEEEAPEVYEVAPPQGVNGMTHGAGPYLGDVFEGDTEV